MAPTCNRQNCRCKRVKFARGRKSCRPKPPPPQYHQPAQTQQVEEYANIVLYYLSKLKNLFMPFSSSNNNNKGVVSTQTSQISLYRHTNRHHSPIMKPILKKPHHNHQQYNSHNNKGESPPPPLPRVKSCRSMHHPKAYDIVDAALQFGCANDVIENVGEYFLVKKKSASRHRLAQRRPTPGPDYVRCSNCKNLSPTPNKRRTKGY